MHTYVHTYLPTYIHICDRAWENRSYLHVKFGPDFGILKCNNLLSVIYIVSTMSSYMQKSMRNSIKLTGLWISHIEQEIGTII